MKQQKKQEFIRIHISYLAEDLWQLTGKKEEMIEMLGIFIAPGRMKCALLSLKTLIKAIEKHEQSPKN